MLNGNYVAYSKFVKGWICKNINPGRKIRGLLFNRVCANTSGLGVLLEDCVRVCFRMCECVFVSVCL